MGKTLITTQHARGTTGGTVGTRGFGWGESKLLKTLNNFEGPFGNVGFWVGNISYITSKIT